MTDVPMEGPKRVSKRLRYEVLNRDNNTCRYCGGRAPDVELTIDHVVPVALGGANVASNLVAACRDCNAGKSSSHPDNERIAEVADDAVRWAAAMRQAGTERRAQEHHGHDEFLAAWEAHDTGWDYLPSTWRQSVSSFMAAGLEPADLAIVAERAFRPQNVNDRFRYLCGVAWNMVRERQERAQEILAGRQEASSAASSRGHAADEIVPIMARLCANEGLSWSTCTHLTSGLIELLTGDYGYLMDTYWNWDEPFRPGHDAYRATVDDQPLEGAEVDCQYMAPDEAELALHVGPLYQAGLNGTTLVVG